jgi:asparagine synthase (glutamine-hydrolysing)
MCGVIGAVGLNHEKNVRDGLAAMRHRGIRESVASYTGGTIGHVRLPIVGIEEENDQPLRRKNWIVGFVGELLDFKDHDPGATCDAPLAADVWAALGPAGFRGFDGFWSIVTYDTRSSQLHALTDYLAQKPLYYRADEHAIAVASEPDALAKLGPTTPDETYLAAVCKWGYCPQTGRTPYHQVKKMGPGEHLVMTAKGVVHSAVVDRLRPVAEGIQSLRWEIEKAVERRVLSSDVPVAALVSGGLDSAIIYTLAKKHGPVHAYHVENDELAACLRVLSLNDDVTVLDTSPDVSLDEALTFMQEPLDLGSLVPQTSLSKAIAAMGGERVCLTGDGADELFGGYRRAMLYDSQASDVWHELVGWHLPRLDRVMMRNRIEVRSPFLARRVAGIALNLPYPLRRDKKVLRDLFRDALPDGVADTPKRPLKTKAVAEDREAQSIELVRLFREKTWPKD